MPFQWIKSRKIFYRLHIVVVIFKWCKNNFNNDDYRYYYEKCPEVVSEKKTVYVGIALYLVNLHSVDMKAGTFHADFYLYFKGR